LVRGQGYLDAGLWSRAVPIEWCFAPTYVVADHISHVVHAGGTVANQVFKPSTVNGHYAIADTKETVAWKQLIDHDAAS